MYVGVLQREDFLQFFLHLVKTAVSGTTCPFSLSPHHQSLPGGEEKQVSRLLLSSSAFICLGVSNSHSERADLTLASSTVHLIVETIQATALEYQLKVLEIKILSFFSGLVHSLWG